MEMERETIKLYSERCDCYDYGGTCRHNNGGNYHKRDRIHVYRHDNLLVAVLEETTTRDWFNGDNLCHLIYLDGKFSIFRDWRRGTELENLKEDHPDAVVLDTYLDGEARIIYTSPED